MVVVERGGVVVDFIPIGSGLFKSEIQDFYSNHNLHQLAKHGLFDLDISLDIRLRNGGDVTKIMELVGECIGEVYKEQLPPDSEILAGSVWPFQSSIGFSVIDKSGMPKFKSDLPPEDYQVVESFHRGFNKASGIPLSGLGLYARRPSLRGYVVTNENEMLHDMQSTHHLREIHYKSWGKTLRGGIDPTVFTDLPPNQLPKIRESSVNRKTSEVVAGAYVNLDSYSEPNIEIYASVDKFGTIPLLSQYLRTFAIFSKHGLNLQAIQGDEWHHATEDLIISTGKAEDLSLGEKSGIRRVGLAISANYVNDQEVAVICGIDRSGEGRGYIELFVPNSTRDERNKHEMMHHLLSAFANTSNTDIVLFVGPTDHPFYREFISVAGSSMERLNRKYGLPQDYPYIDIYDLGFAGLGHAMGYATKFDPRTLGSIPSTKGILK